MFCRIEILVGDSKRVVCTQYRAGKDWAEIELCAERTRRERGGNGFRLFDLHTGQTTESDGNDWAAGGWSLASLRNEREG